MTEYYMLITRSFWESNPELAKETFRTNMSRHGIVGDIAFKAETNWITGEQTGVIALIAEVKDSG